MADVVMYGLRYTPVGTIPSTVVSQVLQTGKPTRHSSGSLSVWIETDDERDTVHLHKISVHGRVVGLFAVAVGSGDPRTEHKEARLMAFTTEHENLGILVPETLLEEAMANAGGED